MLVTSHARPALLPPSWTQHPLIQKNRRVVLASFLLLLLGLGEWPQGSPAYPHEGSVLPLCGLCTPSLVHRASLHPAAAITPPPFYR